MCVKLVQQSLQYSIIHGTSEKRNIEIITREEIRVGNYVYIVNFFLQGDSDSSSEIRQDKPKNDDPVVDLFPEDENEERNS